MDRFTILAAVLSSLVSVTSADTFSTPDKPPPAVDYDMIVKMAARIEVLETRELQNRQEIVAMKDELDTRDLRYRHQMATVHAKLARQGNEILSLRRLVDNRNKRTTNDQEHVDVRGNVEKTDEDMTTQVKIESYQKEPGNRDQRSIVGSVENTSNDVTAEGVPAEPVNKDIYTRIRKQQVETRVAFFATVNNNTYHLGKNQNVEFDYVVTNEGDGYLPHAGLFVAPVGGTYVFSATITTTERDISDFGFARNDNIITAIYVDGSEKWYDSSSQTIVLQLQKGDDVSVKHMRADHSVAGNSHSTFSGFLLYQSDSDLVVVG